MIPVGNKFSDKEYDHNRKHPREYESNHPLTTCNPKGSANLFHGKPAGNSAEALRCKASGIYIYLGVVDGGLALQILVVGHLAVDEFAVCGEVKDAVADGFDELMVVGSHHDVALDSLQAVV